MIDFLFTSKPLVKTSSPHMFRHSFRFGGVGQLKTLNETHNGTQEECEEKKLSLTISNSDQTDANQSRTGAC